MNKSAFFLLRLIPNFFILFPFVFMRQIPIFLMNKRFIIVGIVLGAAVALAFLVGSPMFGGFDTLR